MVSCDHRLFPNTIIAEELDTIISQYARITSSTGRSGGESSAVLIDPDTVASQMAMEGKSVIGTLRLSDTQLYGATLSDWATYTTKIISITSARVVAFITPRVGITPLLGPSKA